MSRYYSSLLNVLSPSFLNTYSLAFDGVDDFIGLGDAFTSLTAFSISAWFKSDDTSASNQAIVSSRVGSIGVSQGVDIFINNNQLYGRIYDNGATQIITSFTDTSSWHQVILTYNGTNIEMYLDGVSQGTSTGSYTNSSADWIIGKWNNGAFYFDGKIDEVAIWNSDQSSNIGSIYSASGAVDLTSLNPTAWYRNGDNGSYKSPQWLIPNNSNKDKVSNFSFDFDGVDDYISFSSITLSAEFTISAWIKPTNLGSNTSHIISTGTSNSNRIGIYTADTLQIKLGGSNVYLSESGGNDFVQDVWQHVLIVRDNSNNITAFRNGASFGTSVSNSNTGTLDSIFRFNNTRYSSGNLDEVAIWQSDQSSNVASIYNSGTPTTITGAVAHWKMGEQATFSTNWTVPDQVGSNDGTSANMTIEDRTGDAPNSTSNALSYNMTESDRETDVPS